VQKREFMTLHFDGRNAGSSNKTQCLRGKRTMNSQIEARMQGQKRVLNMGAANCKVGKGKRGERENYRKEDSGGRRKGREGQKEISIKDTGEGMWAQKVWMPDKKKKVCPDEAVQ